MADREQQLEKERARRVARERRLQIAPQLAPYDQLDRDTVLWPIVTATSRPGFTSPVVTVDGRGHRVTTVDGESTRSDAAPEGAAFLLGGSYAFGVGATSDAGTLAAALWRRTGRPWVNLGVRAASSVQEFVTALPFLEWAATFVVCSGINNFALALAAPGLDPLFGPIFNDRRLRKLSAVPIQTLFHQASGTVGAFEDAELRAALVRRLTRKRRPKEPASATLVDIDEAVDNAARLQLRDLRAIRRGVPDAAQVVFALQPTALRTAKELSPEEQELFEALDVLQGRRWQQRKALFDSHWDGYAARLEEGCAALGVPFADLSRGEYTGWTFVDRGHMTDRGYEQAAALVRL